MEGVGVETRIGGATTATRGEVTPKDDEVVVVVPRTSMGVPSWARVLEDAFGMHVWCMLV